MWDQSQTVWGYLEKTMLGLNFIGAGLHVVCLLNTLKAALWELQKSQ